MNKYKTLFSNTILISIGTFTSKLLVFLMVRFYTGYLTPSDYSIADLLTQSANLLFPIISFGITEGIFRFAMDDNYDKKGVFSIGAIIITLGGLLFFIIAPLLNLVNDFKGFVWLIVLYTMAACYHALCAQYIRAIGKTGLFAVQGIINTALVIIFNILFLAFFNMGVTGYVLSVAVADILCTLILILKEKLWKNITLSFKKSALFDILKYSIPLIPTTVFWWVTSVSDRYMVNEMVSSAENGIYTVAYKLPTLLTLLATIFMQAWQFSAVKEDDGNKDEHALFFGKVWGSFQALMFIAGAFVIAMAKPLMKILTTDSFYTAWEFVPLLAIAMVYTAFASFTGTVYVVNKKSNISFYTALIGASSNVLMNFILIPVLKAQGAAIATVVSYLLVFIIRSVNSRKYIPFKFQIKHIIINSVIIFVQALFLIFEWKFWIVAQILCTAFIIVFNFNFLKEFLDKILSNFLRRKR